MQRSLGSTHSARMWAPPTFELSDAQALARRSFDTNLRSIARARIGALDVTRLAALVPCHRSHIYATLAGKRGVCVDGLAAFANALRVSPSMLLHPVGSIRGGGDRFHDQRNVVFSDPGQLPLVDPARNR